MSKLIKIIGTVLSVIFFVGLTLFFIFMYEMEWKTTEIARYENTKNGYEIIFEEKGASMFFGPSEVNVILVDEKNHKVETINTYIYDDGSIIQRGNCSVNWNDLYVEVVLSGDEQANEIHKMYYK